MKVGDIFSLLGLAIVLGIVTEVVTAPNTAKVVSSSGSAFANIIHSAMGH
jgi:hypothetical protein